MRSSERLVSGLVVLALVLLAASAVIAFPLVRRGRAALPDAGRAAETALAIESPASGFKHAETTGVEGTGLVLGKRLIEVMKGSLGLNSPPGDAREGERTILYIEDNLDNLRLVEKIMAKRPGERLVAAMKGTLGIEIAAARTPSLILLDLHLPGLSGTEVIRQIRSHPDLRRVPVAVVGAGATPGQIRLLMDPGADDYPTQPIDFVKFRETLDRHLSRGGKTA